MSKFDVARAKGRAAATPRREPHWLKLKKKGRYLGFRKMLGTLSETWIARWTDADSKYHYKALDAADYEEANEKAEVWFTQCGIGVIRSGTVTTCCQQYVADRRDVKGDTAADKAEATFKRTVYGTRFGDKKLDVLTTADIVDWRKALVTESRSRRSVNRIMRGFKAALNLGFKRGLCPSDRAWNPKLLKPLEGDGAKDKARTAYLTPHQRGLLLQHASTSLSDLLRGHLYTAARPGELVAATVNDFDPIHRCLTLSTRKGGERSRNVPLSPAAVEFFKRTAKDKLPNAKLMGEWDRPTISAAMRTAVKAANDAATSKEDRLPLDTVVYTMRHCAICDMMKAGIDVGNVAKIAGTSIGMIDKHYSKYVQTDIQDKLATIAAF